MKVCILSDARLPTNPQHPGHGLGQIVHAVASGLADCGHTVTLYAGNGSAFQKGRLIVEANETDFLRHDLTQYDAVMDNSHQKITRAIKGLPVIQVSHDRESTPSINAVYPTNAHMQAHGKLGKVVHNGVKIPSFDHMQAPRDYVAYVSTFYPPKGAMLALEAARLAGVRILFAGTTPPAPPPGAEYVGPLRGADKLEFMARAKALVFPSAIEAGPVTPLEAQSVGCPVIVSAYGGASENMQAGLTGFTARDTLGFAEAIRHINEIDRSTCRQWIVDNRSEEKMIDAYEKLLTDVAAGVTW